MTDTTQHTPGPWQVETEHYNPYFVGDGYRLIATCQHDETMTVHIGISEAEAQANANLIAQAPTLKAENEALKALNVELVEALDKLTYQVTDGTISMDLTCNPLMLPSVKQAQTLITKAKEVSRNG